MRISAAVIVLALLVARAAQADWQYTERTDPMTSKRTLFAVLESNNSLSLDFPYRGENHGQLTVRQHPKWGLDVIFQVEKGQIMCSSFRGCGITVRFDDSPPVRFDANESADHDSKVIFLSNEGRFISAASKAKRILVQVNMFQNGAPILEFHSSKPLEWKPRK